MKVWKSRGVDFLLRELQFFCFLTFFGVIFCLPVEGADVFFNPLFFPKFTQRKILTSHWFYEMASRPIRVLIFPHVDEYPAPHGTETQLETVQLVSEGRCELTHEMKPLERIWSFPFASKEMNTGESYQNLLAETTSRTVYSNRTNIKFDYDTLEKPTHVRCERPTKVGREAGLVSHTYRGEFLVKRGITPRNQRMIKVINILPFEDYLTGVVPAEMPSSWPSDSLKAQAVAARTYGYAHMAIGDESTDPSRDFDVDDTILYQAYTGLDAETASSNGAVRLTSGQVLTYNSTIIIPYFSADSGGHTEASENVWGTATSYCNSKLEIYDLSLVKSDWTVRLYLSQINERLQKVGIISSDNPVIQIGIEDPAHFPSGRVIDLKLTMRNGGTQFVRATEFRKAVRLRSTLFSIKRIGGHQNDPEFIFSGRGYGHGVGLNQWGAKVLVENLHWDYKKILNFYYDGVHLQIPELGISQKIE